MKKKLTLLTHGASSSGGTLAAEVVAVILAGAPVEAGVGVAWLLDFVMRLASDMGDGGSWRQCGRGDSCCGGGAGGGGGWWCGNWCCGCGGTPAIEGPAGSAWRATSDVGGRRRPGGGGGGGSSCGDRRWGGSSGGEEGDGGQACQ